MRPLVRTLDEEIARIASRQHGVVTRKQLLTAGASRDQIRRRVRKGHLLNAYPGVYRAGHRAPSNAALYMAAVLACGEGSLLCGRAAGHLLGLLRRAPTQPEVVSEKDRRVAGIRIRRARTIDRRDSALFNAIPVTTVPRTVVDLAADLPPKALARVWHEAVVRHKARPAQVEAVLERRPTSPGAKDLRRVLYGDERATLSRLEERFLDLLRENGLPLPKTNRPAGARFVDCRWPEHALTVELDSYRYHHTRHAWEEDSRRERLARAREDEYRRYVWGDVFEHPALMLRELAKLLSAGSQVRRDD